MKKKCNKYEEKSCIVRYNGNNIDCVGIEKGDTIEVALQKITDFLCPLSGGGSVGISDITYNDQTGEVTITLTDGNSTTFGDIRGTDGQDGLSAYQIWLQNGNVGSEQDFLDSLIGDDGLQGLQGQNGESAYQIWIDEGNTGTEQDFLDSLIGDNGLDGQNGTNGTDGQDGLSAYQIWINEGNEGTEQDFLNSLKGADGSNGEDGKSAYQIWLDEGNEGTEQDFLDSLKGEQGDLPKIVGKSGSNIDLDSVIPVPYNMNSPIDTDEYNIVIDSIMGTAFSLHNSATEPTVLEKDGITEAKKMGNSETFVANENMYLWLRNNGVWTDYWFESLVEEAVITPPALSLTPTTEPFTLPAGTDFYQDVPYGTDPRNILDIMVPTSGSPTGLVILSHGGGFISGNKEFFYAGATETMIQGLLTAGVAVASINYRYLDAVETQGINKCVEDQSRALKFLRYYSTYFNLRKDDVCLLGASAGSGLSLLVGTKPNKANPLNPDLIERESTVVKGVVCLETQAGYDPLTWSDNIFSVYQPAFGDTEIIDFVGESELKRLYGADTFIDLYSEPYLTYRSEVNLYTIDNTTPELYIYSYQQSNTVPLNISSLYHHPLQAKALQDNAVSSGSTVKALIPNLAIDTTSGETFLQFMIRVVGE